MSKAVTVKIKDKRPSILVGLDLTGESIKYSSNLITELARAETELDCLNESIRESEETIKKLTPECDKLDYALAVSCGAISGIFDIFLVGKPSDSVVGELTDDWFGERTKDFARLFGWPKSDDHSLASALLCLEKKFKIPYDQVGLGGAGQFVFELSPSNHHFKSLAHNPSLLGLFFSILNQFTNTSTFVTKGQLITLEKADGSFELQGHDVPSKMFCAFINWFGHLISDMSGSYTSKGRGMGIPSPLWTWTNDIIAIKHSLGIHDSSFGEAANELALNIYTKGYDLRFQTAQAMPVFINELLVRTVYAIRRLIGVYRRTEKGEQSFKKMWDYCEPFSNASVKRMLTVAHGTFCVIDMSDAAVRGVVTGAGSLNVAEFFMRLNIVGLGRFTISLYGEANRSIQMAGEKKSIESKRREREILEWYVSGLKELAEYYDDTNLISFADDIIAGLVTEETIDKAILLARKRNVPENKIMKTKEERDRYFQGGEI